MIAKILFNISGVLFFFFIFWKKLKEDYDSESIFTFAVFIVAGIGIFNFVSQRILPQWWFWADCLGVILGFILGRLKFKFRFFESLEATTIGLLPWFSFIFLQDAILSTSLSSLIAFIILLLIMAFYAFLDAHYKKFTWYKSGKVGFSGLTTLGVLFLIRTAVAVGFPSMLSFLGSIDSIISGVIAFTSFLLVFNLSRQQT
ncbi:hypothetical protein KKH23_01340 [Patescibacteria group bacterium]|nr:hypothetical protein [Patescibacteria group bacterium]MBU0777136.1 hypothetical protein [Patescibacteria group bacterium]MBU0845830.1 hypothetical protein [Patescibacteria group bacterium]MBU0922857.1 hypothetical protein [Patescibacteria group bacterium]MBU1066410.1 hypothetical protein [Patescibacteria group bacterium]